MRPSDKTKSGHKPLFVYPFYLIYFGCSATAHSRQLIVYDIRTMRSYYLDWSLMRISRKGRIESFDVILTDAITVLPDSSGAGSVTVTKWFSPGFITVPLLRLQTHLFRVSTSLIMRSALPVFSIRNVPLATLPAGFIPKSTSEGSILIDGAGSSLFSSN